jgi:SAM-dependent methyltransferase
MSEVFATAYASSYDALYQDKDYAGECDLIEQVLRAHGQPAARELLDLGCGTGGHAVELARRGYRVVGVDRSESMLAVARAKAAGGAVPGGLELHQGDIRTVRLGRQFDAVLSMFGVLSYQVNDDDIAAALATAASHLRAGGLLVADVWFGPAVLHERPTERTRVIPMPGGYVLRAATPSLDLGRQVVTVDYHLWHVEGDRITSETREQHAMRFFFPRELELLLRQAGLTLLHLSAFPHVQHAPDETTWSVLLVARRP